MKTTHIHIPIIPMLIVIIIGIAIIMSIIKCDDTHPVNNTQRVVGKHAEVEKAPFATNRYVAFYRYANSKRMRIWFVNDPTIHAKYDSILVSPMIKITYTSEELNKRKEHGQDSVYIHNTIHAICQKAALIYTAEEFGSSRRAEVVERIHRELDRVLDGNIEIFHFSDIDFYLTKAFAKKLERDEKRRVDSLLSLAEDIFVKDGKSLNEHERATLRELPLELVKIPEGLKNAAEAKAHIQQFSDSLSKLKDSARGRGYDFPE
jgi:hypothetical protein